MKDKKGKFEPRCISGQSQAAVNNRGHLLPCCWTDEGWALEEPELKKIVKVSKISEYDDIEDILFTKEWIEFYSNLKAEKNIATICRHHCTVREHDDKLKREYFIDETGKEVWKDIR